MSATQPPSKQVVLRAGSRHRCLTCEIDRQKCSFTVSDLSCDRCSDRGYNCRVPPGHLDRRRLSKFKCNECRKSKQKCLPENRVWPAKCELCLRRGLECSEPRPCAKQPSSPAAAIMPATSEIRFMPRVWRVRGVPQDFDVAALADFLHRHPSLRKARINNLMGETDDGDEQSILVGTLAHDSCSRQHATVCFTHLPPYLEHNNELKMVMSSSAVDDHHRVKRKRDDTGSAEPTPPLLTIDKGFDGITILHTPRAEEHDVDIVAIPGLGSHAYGSFTHTDGHMWLCDSLPRDIPTARIMTYGYDWGFHKSDNFRSLSDLANSFLSDVRSFLIPKRKPLILIAHSLGGLILKEALIQLAESDSSSDMLKLVSGLLLFGVPNHGLDNESLAPLVFGQSKRLGQGPLSAIRLQISTSQKRDISKILAQKNIEMFCFYEMRTAPTAIKDSDGDFKLDGPAKCLVTHLSATDFLPPTTPLDHIIAMDRSHSDLVKFALHDVEYENVRQVLSSIYGRLNPSRTSRRIRTITPILPEGHKPQNGLLVLPFGRNRDFVGREPVLNRLLEIILSENNNTGCQMTVLEGLGGVGKTQIALEASYRIRDAHPNYNVFWVPAINATAFDNAYREIGRQLGIQEMGQGEMDIKSLVKSALYQAAHNWLMVVDNADDMELFLGSLHDYLPMCHRGSILFTTRTHRIVQSLDIPRANVLRVGTMSRMEALQLLQNNLSAEQMLDAESTSELLDLLADVPLAVKQASAYMDRTHSTTARYLELCRVSEDSLIQLLSKEFVDRGRYHSTLNPVAMTWQTSFHQISRDAPQSARYLEYLLLLNHEDIPKKLLPPTGDEIEMNEAMGTLQAYAFVTERKQDSYEMHRLVWIALRRWLRDAGELTESVMNLMKNLTNVFPQPKHENKQIWTRYLPHALAVLEIGRTSADQVSVASLVSLVAECIFLLGNYEEAEGFNREALSIRQSTLGHEHPVTLTSMNNLTETLRSRGKFEEARLVCCEAIAIHTRLLGREHPDTLTGMGNLASILLDQGQYNEAEKMLQQIIMIRTQILGSEHPDTLASTNYLAEILQRQGRYDAAKTLSQNTLSLYNKMFGSKHPNTLISMNTLAATCFNQGRYEEAEQLCREILGIRKELLGSEHPETLSTMGYLAEVLRLKGERVEAEALLRNILEARRKFLGMEDPLVLDTMSKLADVLFAQEKYSEAGKIHHDTINLLFTVLHKAPYRHEKEQRGIPLQMRTEE